MIFASSDFGLSFLLEWVAIPLFFLITIRYVVLRGVRGFFPPLRQLMADRRETIRQQLEASEQARAEAEELLAEHRQALEGAREEAEAIVAQARRSAEQLVAQGRERSEAEYAHVIARAEAAIELARAQVREEAIARIGSAVVAAASRLVAAELDEAGHRRLIDEAIGAAEGEGR